MSHYASVLDTIIHQGMTTFRTRHSKVSAYTRQLMTSMESKSQQRQGVQFVVATKANLQTAYGVKGYIVTSKETIFDNANDLTHWTPNTYRYGEYANYKRTHIKGHSENNLQQVNCFVVDIDSHVGVSIDLIRDTTQSLGLGQDEPTTILKTDKGFQVYFVLKAPCFISNANNFKSLKVAKKIANTLKSEFKKRLPATDVGCNDFGFFRIPRQDNIVFSNIEALYDFKTLINWSMKHSVSKQKPNIKSVENIIDYTQQPWFTTLLNATTVKGGKGKLGRNNVLFTLALSCYQSNKSEQYAIDLLDQFNSNLVEPVKYKEVEKAISSAFSGRYKGARLDFIQELMADYGNGINVNRYFEGGSRGFYKHKKKREDRINSHYDEWQKDLEKFLQDNHENYYVSMSLRNLSKASGVPLTSLKHILKTSKLFIKTVIGKGCNAVSKFTTTKLLIEKCKEMVMQKKGMPMVKLFKIFMQEVNELIGVGTEERKGIDAMIRSYWQIYDKQIGLPAG